MFLARPALPLRLALAALALITFLFGAPALADPPKPPASADAGEEPLQGATAPDLTTTSASSALLGAPIKRVQVIVLGDRWTTAPAVASVKLGEPLSRETARRAMRELMDGGGFARASVDAIAGDAADGGGAVLRVYVVPRRLVASIQVKGGTLDEADMLESADLAEGGELTPLDLPQISTRVRAYYHKHGFRFSAVKVETADTDDPARVLLSLTIYPGAPTVVKQRVFVIDPKLDVEVGDLKTKYKVTAGARVDDGTLADADRDLTDLLHQKGFLRATVRHDTRQQRADTFLYIFLEPGPRLVPTFDGNRSFDGDQLLEELHLEKATEPKGLAQRVRDFYVARGFLDAEVDVEEKGNADDAVHFLTFTIVEHEQVRVQRRVFSCLPADVDPDEMGREIESFLEEELPGGTSLGSGDPRVIDHLFGSRGGGRGLPVDLNAAMTYAPDTYDRALKHLRDLFQARGYLNVQVGPIGVVRARCNKRSRDGECIPEPHPAIHARCDKDAGGLPLPEPQLPESLTCRPDRAHDVHCSPDVTLRIPIQLGPRTTLFDLAFEGNKAFAETRLARAVDLTLGDPLSNVELEAARHRVLELYRTEGFAYAEVHVAIEPSPDRTRARARFYVTEHDRVIVSGFVVKGATRTDEGIIFGRLALKKGAAYRQDWARQSEERIATLGTFSSVAIALEDADVPQRQKRVVITVVEQVPQYLDPKIGFSTGEGIRFGFEYGHRNIGGLAIALTLRVQLSYLFDFMILDQGVRRNYEPLSVGERLERRDTVSVTFPEIGLGPLVSLTVDGIDVRDNQRDFGITKQAFVPTIAFRPRRQLSTQLSASAELNDVNIFNESALNTAIQLLRAPEGRTVAIAQRAAFTYDGRDNAFAATKGILISTSVEHVNAYPSATTDNKATDLSHFLRLTGKVSGYVRLTQKGTSIAMSLAGGYNLQLNGTSKTYPDRLFFLGGVDSVRAFLADALVPEDIAQSILRGDRDAKNKVITIDSVAIRGGNIALNPRIELRVPVTDLFAAGFFLDMGNLWVDPKALDLTALRYALGAGLRIVTPFGPIAFDYGVNMIRRPWEDFGAFHFSIGLF